MIFDNLNNIVEKLEELSHSEDIYYHYRTDTITSYDGMIPYVTFSRKDRQRLISFYKRAYYINTQMACIECREHALIQLDIEFNNFLIDIKERYWRND